MGAGLRAVCDRGTLLAILQAVEVVYVSESIAACMVDIVSATRQYSTFDKGTTVRQALLVELARVYEEKTGAG